MQLEANHNTGSLPAPLRSLLAAAAALVQRLMVAPRAAAEAVLGLALALAAVMAVMGSTTTQRGHQVSDKAAPGQPSARTQLRSLGTRTGTFCNLLVKGRLEVFVVCPWMFSCLGYLFDLKVRTAVHYLRLTELQPSWL